MQNIEIYNAHCCGEIGEVIVAGDIKLEGRTILEQSKFLFKDNKFRNFLLNEPRGGVFKHYNLIVPSQDEKAEAGFIIMEPEDNPPMSGSNSMCVATVLLEKKIVKMSEPITEFFLEAPGGLVKIIAECQNKKVKYVTIQNLPSFVDKLDATLKTSSFGKITVSTVFGGDTFVICRASDFNLIIEQKNARKFVEIAKEIIPLANSQLGFSHPSFSELNYISFCQFIEPFKTNDLGIKEGKNTVYIRPGKLDRSPCGTGTSARLALMRATKQIGINENFISHSIIDSTFTATIIKEYEEDNMTKIIPTIRGQVFIMGKQEFYVSKDDPFPEGYKLNDTWPQN